MILIIVFFSTKGPYMNNQTTMSDIYTIHISLDCDEISFDNPYCEQLNKPIKTEFPLIINLPLENDGLQCVTTSCIEIEFQLSNHDEKWNNATEWSNFIINSDDIIDDETTNQIIYYVQRTISNWQKQHIIMHQTIDTLNGDYYIIKSCKIDKIVNQTNSVIYDSEIMNLNDNAEIYASYGKTIIHNMCNNSIIQYLHDSSWVKKMYDNTCIHASYDDSQINYMFDLSHIKFANNNTFVSAMNDDAFIECATDNTRVLSMANNSHIHQLNANANVAVMFNYSMIHTLHDKASVNKMINFSRIREMKNYSNVKNMSETSCVYDMYNSSSIDEMFDNSIVYVLHDKAFIQYMTNYSLVKHLCNKAIINSMDQHAIICDANDETYILKMKDKSVMINNYKNCIITAFISPIKKIVGNIFKLTTKD